MLIPNTAFYSDLRSFFKPENLAFRAACNGVAPASSQPIKIRVIKRIYSSSEAQLLLVRVWNGIGVVPDCAFAKALTEDLCWKTLVLEEISHEKRWVNIFQPTDGKTISDYLKSFFEKIRDGANHPAAKTATAIVLSVAGIGVTNKLTSGLLTIPVKASLSQDALPLGLKIDGIEKPLTVQYQATTPISAIPVNLQFGSEGKPIGVQFTEGGEPARTIHDIATQLTATNQSISSASSSLRDLPNRSFTVDTKGLDDSIAGISAHIADTTGRLNELNAKLESLQSDLDASVKAQQSAAKQQVEALNRSLQVVGRASQRNIISLTLRRGVPQAAVLPYLDAASGEISAKTIDFLASKIGRDDQGRFVLLTWTPEKNPPQTVMLREGVSAGPINPPGYRISLNTTSRKWLISKVAELTLTPEAAQLTGNIASTAPSDMLIPHDFLSSIAANLENSNQAPR
jgi:hypothetical protein